MFPGTRAKARRRVVDPTETGDTPSRTPTHAFSPTEDTSARKPQSIKHPHASSSSGKSTSTRTLPPNRSPYATGSSSSKSPTQHAPAGSPEPKRPSTPLGKNRRERGPDYEKRPRKVQRLDEEEAAKLDDRDKERIMKSQYGRAGVHGGKKCPPGFYRAK